MLSPQQIEYADASFGVYDHDWRYYSEFLGEPFLYEDCLAYFDGKILYVVAFPLSDCHQNIDESTIERTLAAAPFRDSVKGVVVWGRYKTMPSRLLIDGKSFDVIVNEDESTMTDLVLDVSAFSYDRFGDARRAKNAAMNKGLVTKIEKRDRYGFEHIALMERFFEDHDISPSHASFYLSTANLIKNSNVFLVEAYLEERLRGFAVVSQVNPIVASMLIGFYDNSSRSRAADGVFAKTIDWAIEQKLHRLHFGYSASESLLAFKHKWGANICGPTYREIAYSRDPDVTATFNGLYNHWRERLMFGVRSKNHCG